MKKQTRASVAWGAVLLAGALWGIGAVVAQSVMAGGMAPFSLSLARFALGLPLLWFWHCRQLAARPGSPVWRSLTRRDQWLIGGTGVAMAMNVTSWFMGVRHIGAALPTVISICTAPLVVAAFSVLRGYEKASVRLVVAMSMALVGVGLIAWPAGAMQLRPHYVQGLAWSFASAALYAVVVLGNARMPAHIPAVSASAWSMTVAALLMAALAAGQGVTWPGSGTAWLQVMYTGVMTTSVAYLAFAWGARLLSPTAAVLGTLIEPLVAALAAAWLFGEPLTVQQGAGALLLGVAMLVIGRKTASKLVLP